ncbi:MULTISPECIES: YHYH protein [unclassified Ruegeria]|uniref:YHYH protein n=1 Tax=unclassified Ruegeria TaxID=2625375 RepID=UPI0014884263|nr:MULTISPECIES: YHYH protein [unclassified Ruegeria]
MRLVYLAISALFVGFFTVQANAQNEAQDITNLLLSNRSGDCADYAGVYSASVEDVTRQQRFNSEIEISANSQHCILKTNGIPNHDFNGPTANFANNVRELPGTFRIPRNPEKARNQTTLSQRSYDAILLNGVPVDLLSAGCYRPSGRRADKNGNVLAGCRDTDPWLLDPPSYDQYFGVDLHNAHAQPDGRYHYHSNPNALFLDNDLDKPSPAIGFAADGFPIYGTIFKDRDGTIRPAISGYQLKTTPRPAPPNGPGGTPDGTYIDDYEFTGAGDLDKCNGMTVDGQYGYYVTTSYPWVLNCLVGAPDRSFDKR